MTRFIRRIALGGLLALALGLTPRPAVGNGFGLFGPRETVYLGSPVETIYAVPTATSYVVPTTSIVSTSYLVPTASYVYRPARYTLAPTIYRSASTLLPTSYLVGSSYLRPTRYYLDDVVSTSYVPTSYAYSTSLLYPSSVVYDSTPIVVDRPVAAPSPSPSGTSATRRNEPALQAPRQSGNPPGTGRSPELESRAIEPRQPEASAAPAEEEDAGIVPEPSSPPTLPAPGEDGAIEGIMPLPEPFETRTSQRPAFSGGLPGSTLAAATKLVQGRVRDEQTRGPVSGLVVTFSNTVSSFAERRAVTDEDGQFRLAEFLPDGDWSIVVSGSGANAPTRTYPQVTVMGGRIYDRLGRDYSKLVLDY
ncbi:carboxypeptidase-like regulatory domain-containing protein [Tautonia plasticadhaerens]|uniref:Carboxypeptidase regulatory-like domain-containing protein n=1 Tax=Tautonia plasticadhaerens TaxID=2527974 RepID=A0A518GYW6_9BACT|nr:carboxypeptidase-like regulatory domain-containing protein [Tautonia plasticadhaerens]QDV33743.1 hypothetical protein ElP_16220 [Tautonia plasticadhaerens]